MIVSSADRFVLKSISQLPFQSLVLYLPMLIVKSLEQAIGEFRRRGGIVGEEGGGVIVEDAQEIIERHVADVGVRVIELYQQSIQTVEG
jgi:hypothetical protein